MKIKPPNIFFRLLIIWPEAWDYLICPILMEVIPWPVILGSMVPLTSPHTTPWPVRPVRSLVGPPLHQAPAPTTPSTVSHRLIGAYQEIDGLQRRESRNGLGLRPTHTQRLFLGTFFFLLEVMSITCPAETSISTMVLPCTENIFEKLKFREIFVLLNIFFCQ